MAKTPFIQPLQLTGGTFYTFSSAAEDLSFTFNNSTSKFKFSKFALLNIPNIDYFDTTGNTIKLPAPDSAFLDWSSGSNVIVPADGNIAFSQSFQSYCLNIETTILSSDEYDSNLKQNVSERVFFKWLKELGAIRFQPASSTEVASTLNQNSIVVTNNIPITQKRFVEGDPVAGVTGSFGLTGAVYNNVVQYVGELDIVNSVRNENNAYTEVYVYVPTKDGSTPTVLFKNVVDQNYTMDYTWTNNPSDPLNDEYLTGRAYTETNPSGLTNLAIFDDDVLGQPSATYTDTANGTTGSGNWYSPRAVANTYFNDALFTDPTSLIITKTNTATPPYTSLTYTRTKLDSIGIDFDPDSYYVIATNPSISTFSEFNATADANNFDFNAVLIYYDVYDPANPSDSATNLYGVLFLDDVVTSGGETYIPRLTKNKPNIVTKLNGNSYGFKINLKFDVDVDQTGVEQAINDYSPFSLSMFMDAVNVLQDASSTLNNGASQVIGIEQRLTKVENLVLTSDSSLDLSQRIDFLEQTISANQALFNNTQSIIGLINQNYELIRAIVNNDIPSIEISYNLDVIKQGIGILVDKTIENEVTISNDTQNYTIGKNKGVVTLSTTSNNILSLLPFGNYYKHVNNGSPLSLSQDLTIRIDDANFQWKRGQTFRFSFGDEVYPNDFVVTFLTNAVGRYPLSSPTNVPYSKTILVLDKTDFATWANIPVIDIVCVDPENLVFQVDAVGQSLTNNP
jgi:hypothetical protein